MEKLKKLQCLDASTLKIFAMVFMLIDHIGYIFFPYKEWIRILGRVSFPIFAYFVAEGYVHTRNPLKYMGRMAIFAVITEPIFDMAFFGRITIKHQSVLVTFLAALLGLYLRDKIESIKCDAAFDMQKKLGGYAVIVGAAILAEVLDTDYGCFGVMLVYVYQVLHNNFVEKHLLAGILQLFGTTGIQRYSIVSTIPLMLYNGKRGIGLKYLFYTFYPAHLLVLYLIAGYVK